MPARPSASASALETASCQFFGLTVGSATVCNHVSTGCQSGAHCSQPPMTASTARTPTVEAIETPTTSRWSAWKCSRTNALGSPQKTRNSIRNVYRPVRNVPASPTTHRR